MIKTFAARSEMCGWEHVPARALSAGLITRHGESTTYKVVARYEYDYQGRRYVGDRVGIDATGSDNIGTWH